MKKLYESPDVEKCCFNTEELLNGVPSVSDNGFGWDEEGPAGLRTQQ